MPQLISYKSELTWSRAGVPALSPRHVPGAEVCICPRREFTVVAALFQTGLTCAGIVLLTLMGISGDVSEVAVLGGYRVLPTAYSGGIIAVLCRERWSGRVVVRTGDRRVAHLVAFRFVLGSGSGAVGQWCLAGIGIVQWWTW